MKKGLVFLGCVAVVAAVYLAGPRLEREEVDRVLPVVACEDVEGYVREREAALPVKPGNESVVVWADSAGRRTEWVLLYLHGFSASRYEGYPVTRDFVERFGVNAYLPRLAEHGLEVAEPLLEMTPKRLYDSAKEALVVAHRLGEKVVVMGTSTGGTLALMLAADFPELVDALVLYSPNVRIRNPFAPLLSGPWGLQISRAVHGGKYAVDEEPAGSETCKYWYCRYRVEAQVYLQQLLDMRISRIRCSRSGSPPPWPPPSMESTAELGTPEGKKRKAAFPEAGAHVIGCELTSGAVEEVEEETFRFMEEVAGLVSGPPLN